MPTIDIPDRICSKCDGIRWNLRISKRLSSSGEKYKWYICYQCELIRLRKKQQAYRIKYPDKIKSSNKISSIRIKNDSVRYQKRLEQTRHLKAKGLYKHLDKTYRDRIIKNLTDNYIKRLIIVESNLKYSDIPQDLIDLKRKQLLLTRKIKQS